MLNMLYPSVKSQEKIQCMCTVCMYVSDQLEMVKKVNF